MSAEIWFKKVRSKEDGIECTCICVWVTIHVAGCPHRFAKFSLEASARWVTLAAQRVTIGMLRQAHAKLTCRIRRGWKGAKASGHGKTSDSCEAVSLRNSAKTDLSNFGNLVVIEKSTNVQDYGGKCKIPNEGEYRAAVRDSSH
jgi:hypothetical protein